MASEKSVEGTADIRRLNEPQMPSVCTVVLVPGSEKMERDSGHLLAAGTSSTRGHGHGHVTAVKGGVTASTLALALVLASETSHGPLLQSDTALKHRLRLVAQPHVLLIRWVMSAADCCSLASMTCRSLSQ